MTNYINWMQMNQVVRSDVIPTNGNAAGNHETTASGVASGVAPEGAQYALVWSDAASGSTVSATNLQDSSGLGSGKTVAIPSKAVLEVVNITPGQTQITMTDL